MRRVLPVAEFRTLDRRLPAGPGLRHARLHAARHRRWSPTTPTPRSAICLGLTLSRAAALRSIAGALPDGPGRTALLASAEAHLARGLPTVSSGDFSSDHWLATSRPWPWTRRPATERRVPAPPRAAGRRRRARGRTSYTRPMSDSAPRQPAPGPVRRHHRAPCPLAASPVAARGGAGPDPLPYADNLLDRWAEPQRRYHTTAHLTAVLDRIDTLAGTPPTRTPCASPPGSTTPSTAPTAPRTRSAAPPSPSARCPRPGVGAAAHGRGRPAGPAHRHPRPGARRHQRRGAVRRGPRVLAPARPRSTRRTPPPSARSTASSPTTPSARAGPPSCASSSSCPGSSAPRTARRTGKPGPGRT